MIQGKRLPWPRETYRLVGRRGAASIKKTRTELRSSDATSPREGRRADVVKWLPRGQVLSSLGIPCYTRKLVYLALWGIIISNVRIIKIDILKSFNMKKIGILEYRNSWKIRGMKNKNIFQSHLLIEPEAVRLRRPKQNCVLPEEDLQADVVEWLPGGQVLSSLEIPSS